MADHWRAVLGVERVGLQHDFFESGGSSVKLIELIHHLQDEFNLAIPVSHLFRVTTLQGMARTVEHIITGRLPGAQPWLRFNPDAGPVAFCFPPAGGHGLVYRLLAAHLPGYELVAFNYLTGDDKTARYADLIESLQPQGHCELLGYSLGGNLAFEVAKELEHRGREYATSSSSTRTVSPPPTPSVTSTSESSSASCASTCASTPVPRSWPRRPSPRPGTTSASAPARPTSARYVPPSP
ncbi:hypothetical protein GCM10023238_08760 [Streptomyces heliomycini]